MLYKRGFIHRHVLFEIAGRISEKPKMVGKPVYQTFAVASLNCSFTNAIFAG
jgi:hypothetical protein